MDARLTLPILLLLVAVSLTGAVETALRPVDDTFTLSPPADGSAGCVALAMAGPLGASPALIWSGVPDGTQAFVLFAEDLDAGSRQRVFWLVTDLAADLRRIDGGHAEYRAPSWTATATHRLRFTLLALSTPVQNDRAELSELKSRALGTAVWYTGGGWAF